MLKRRAWERWRWRQLLLSDCVNNCLERMRSNRNRAGAQLVHGLLVRVVGTNVWGSLPFRWLDPIPLEDAIAQPLDT